MKLKIIGVMTGTSCDGLDAACVSFNQNKWKVLWSRHLSFPSELKIQVLDLQKPGVEAPIEKWLELDRKLGIWYGKSVLRLMKQEGEADVIANHGQTLAHFPKRSGGTTLQLGDPAQIAYISGKTTISHFRDGDMASGGEGAPLAPLLHQMIVSANSLKSKGVSIHNLGGMSNFTYFGGGRVTAFDTGPANIWIDEAVHLISKGKKTYDRNGLIGRKGSIDHTAIKKILRHPYFLKNPPKSTGRDDFPFEYFKKRTNARNEDLVATATEVTIRTIVDAYQKYVLKRGLPLKEIHLSGGGAYNQYIVERIAKELPQTKVQPIDLNGLTPDRVEAVAFAYFGLLSLLGKSLSGSWTGGKLHSPPGKITPGQNWNRLLKKLTRS